MLKQRIITGVSLAVFLMAILFFAPVIVGQVLLSFISLLGAWEWMNLMGWKNHLHRLWGILLILALIASVALFKVVQLVWVGLGFFFWIAMIGGLFKFESTASEPTRKIQQLFRQPVFQTSMGFLVLGPFLAGWWILLDHPAYKSLALLLLASIISADTGAYLTGRLWGKHKLAPHISPHKSLEGLIGGVCFSLLVSSVIVLSRPPLHFSGIEIVIGGLTGLISAAGDLLESVMKRLAGVKDSGRFLPGHGGILDRIDAFTAGTPFFITCLLIIGF